MHNNKFDWTQYTGNLKWLPERTLFLSMHGSHAYGTATPTSDIDIRGIAVAPLEYYLGVSKVFEQTVQHEPIDLTIFDLRKFVKLAADANPNALEFIFTDPSDHLLVHPVMEILLENRDLFLSKKCKYTFSGYAVSQLKRIKSHRRWLMSPPIAAPTREEFALPDQPVIPTGQLTAAQAAVLKQIDEWSWHELEHVDPATRQALQSEFNRRLLEITKWDEDAIDDKVWLSAARTIGFDENFIRLLDLERQYTSKLREWQQYQHWKATRNKARSELEAKYGMDTKHAAHLVRLTRCCRELLETGKLNVRRPDAEELLAIRNGAWTYEQLIEYSENEDKALSELMKTSTLPRQPDLEKIDQLCLTIIQKMA